MHTYYICISQNFFITPKVKNTFCNTLYNRKRKEICCMGAKCRVVANHKKDQNRLSKKGICDEMVSYWARISLVLVSFQLRTSKKSDVS